MFETNFLGTLIERSYFIIFPSTHSRWCHVSAYRLAQSPSTSPMKLLNHYS